MHPLTPVLREYAWGTSTDITELLGLEPTGGPVAEAWWGAHEDGPSTVHRDVGDIPLDALVAGEPASCLGPAAYEEWGPRLPFLLKVLAIDKPLSIQVHPSAAPAREGYEREQAHPTDAPRTYHDPFHKPEMVLAFTHMRVLAGVRPLADLRGDLAQLGTAGASRLSAAVSEHLDDYINLALAGDGGDETLQALARVGANAPEGSSLRVCADALVSFPGDAGALVALAMNVVDLAPGESLFVGAGMLHSYQSGIGIEIMASSDNVVRAGLTPKPVDVPLLLSLATTQPVEPERPTVVQDGAATTMTTQAREFALTVVSDGEAKVPAGPRIVLVTTGTATVVSAECTTELASGQAVFVRDSDGPVSLHAQGRTVVAHLPHTS